MGVRRCAEIDLFFRCNPLFQSRFPLAWTGAGTGAGAGVGGGGGERVQLRTHTTPRARQTVPDCDDETRHISPTLRRHHSTTPRSHSCVCVCVCV
jgi:hypothetical protein